MSNISALFIHAAQLIMLLIGILVTFFFLTLKPISRRLIEKTICPLIDGRKKRNGSNLLYLSFFPPRSIHITNEYVVETHRNKLNCQ